MKIKKYIFDYFYRGKKYTFHVPASSLKEAEERVREMSNAEYIGESKAIIPVPECEWVKRILSSKKF